MTEEIVPTVCMDFDGVIAIYESWEDGMIGEPNPAAVRYMAMLKEAGIKIVIQTCRLNHTWKDTDYARARKQIESWLKKHKIPYDELSKVKGKHTAHVYPNDRGLHWPRNSGDADELFDMTIKRLEGVI